MPFEPELFYQYAEHIAFAALSLNTTGIKNFGPCCCTLSLKMVAHRTSLFHENNLVFLWFERSLERMEDVPVGYRATWDKRAELCVAKLAPQIHVGMNSSDFPDLVLHQASDAKDAKLIEAHIYGLITVRGVEHVSIERRGGYPERSRLMSLKRKASNFGVSLEWH